MKTRDIFDLCVEYQTLLYIEHENNIGGIEYITAEDVEYFFGYSKTYPWVCNILRRLHSWGMIKRKKEKKQKRRGARKYLYKISEVGMNKCTQLNNQGFFM